jgi:hypothetical protein
VCYEHWGDSGEMMMGSLKITLLAQEVNFYWYSEAGCNFGEANSNEVSSSIYPSDDSCHGFANSFTFSLA